MMGLMPHLSHCTTIHSVGTKIPYLSVKNYTLLNKPLQFFFSIVNLLILVFHSPLRSAALTKLFVIYDTPV